MSEGLTAAERSPSRNPAAGSLTVDGAGRPHVSPVGFTYNETTTIDIGG